MPHPFFTLLTALTPQSKSEKSSPKGESSSLTAMLTQTLGIKARKFLTAARADYFSNGSTTRNIKFSEFPSRISFLFLQSIQKPHSQMWEKTRTQISQGWENA